MMKDLSVLLVDHNPLFAQLMTRFLQSEEQVQVQAVSSLTTDVLQKVRTTVPDVILIDLDPTVKESLERICKIRAILPDGLIIAMTLLDTIYYRKAAIHAGADDLVLKADMDSNFFLYMHSKLARRRRKAVKSLSALWSGRIAPNP